MINFKKDVQYIFDPPDPNVKSCGEGSLIPGKNIYSKNINIAIQTVF